MKKVTLAVALLSVFGAVSAQSSITMYGVIDAGVVYNNGSNDAGSVTRLESGIESGSRLGFKGTEDLGNGLKAMFVLEQGYSAVTGVSTQGGRLFGRQAFVGLGGSLGAVTLGRQYTPVNNAYGAIDPFGSNTAGDINTLFGHDADFLSRDFRMDNAVIYTTPSNLGGFNAVLAYGFGGQAGDTTAESQTGLSIGYATGPLNVIYAYHEANNANSVTNTSDFKTHFVGGTYDFKVVKAHAAYDRTSQGHEHDMQSYLIGATIPLGKHSIFGDFIYRDNKRAASANANQVAVGYNHTLSKRTNLYSIVAHTTNRAFSKVNTSVDGNSVTRVQLGVRHIF